MLFLLLHVFSRHALAETLLEPMVLTQECGQLPAHPPYVFSNLGDGFLSEEELDYNYDDTSKEWPYPFVDLDADGKISRAECENIRSYEACEEIFLLWDLDVAEGTNEVAFSCDTNFHLVADAQNITCNTTSGQWEIPQDQCILNFNDDEIGIQTPVGLQTALDSMALELEGFSTGKRRRTRLAPKKEGGANTKVLQAQLTYYRASISLMASDVCSRDQYHLPSYGYCFWCSPMNPYDRCKRYNSHCHWKGALVYPNCKSGYTHHGGCLGFCQQTCYGALPFDCSGACGTGACATNYYTCEAYITDAIFAVADVMFNIASFAFGGSAAKVLIKESKEKILKATTFAAKRKAFATASRAMATTARNNLVKKFKSNTFLRSGKAEGIMRGVLENLLLEMSFQALATPGQENWMNIAAAMDPTGILNLYSAFNKDDCITYAFPPAEPSTSDAAIAFLPGCEDCELGDTSEDCKDCFVDCDQDPNDLACWDREFLYQIPSAMSDWNVFTRTKPTSSTCRVNSSPLTLQKAWELCSAQTYCYWIFCYRLSQTMTLGNKQYTEGCYAMKAGPVPCSNWQPVYAEAGSSEAIFSIMKPGTSPY